MSRTWWPAALLVALAVAPQGAPAQEESAAAFEVPPTTLTTADVACAPAAGFEALFQEAATSIQVLGGGYFSGPPGPRSRAFNYVPFSVRQGVMVSPPEEHWWGRGNYECLFDLTAATITSSYGSWFAGPTFFARANWLEPGWPVVPYAQVGTGGVFTDAYKDPTQHAIGQAFEFYLHLELGLKCFISPNLSLDLEGGLQHLSNGGMARRNYGVNCYGATLGLTYHFPNG